MSKLILWDNFVMGENIGGLDAKQSIKIVSLVCKLYNKYRWAKMLYINIL